MSYFKWWIAGGNNEVGANSHVVEFNYKDEQGNNKHIYLIQELGVSFADRKKADDPDYFYPDVTEYLSKHEDKDRNPKEAQAILLTHGHLDHIGAIAILAKEGYRLPVVYATRRTISLIEGMLEALEAPGSIRYKEIDPKREKSCKIKINDYLNIDWYPVSHSVSGSGGFLYTAKDRDDEEPVRVCFQIDFKTDTTVLIEPGYARSIIQDMGKNKISACFMESTRAESKGRNSTEMKIMDNIQYIINKHPKNRIVATTMATNDQRLAIFVYLAHKNNRKLIYFGRSMEATVKNMKQEIVKSIENRFDIKIDIDETIVNGKFVNLEDIPIEEQLIMLTGTQAEDGAAMTLASKEDHKKFTFKEYDVVLDSASVIPGNEDFVYPMLKRIGETVEKVYTPPMYDIHASGHGLGGELKEFLTDISKTELKSFITMHGEKKHRESLKKLAEEVNSDLKYYKGNTFEILAPNNGDIIEINKNGSKIVASNDKDFLTYTVVKEEF
ncbi:MAG: ribonuclease J [Alphaproteobacteria bacterium]|jgi:ribonuclease J|nr:ribonuclease J [Alphaproteobacteria bacterium]